MPQLTSILRTLDDLDRHVPSASIRNEAVSKWSVGMQIEHAVRATIGICNAVVDSGPYRGTIKKGWIRRFVFLTGIIPRGRGKAPEAAIPSQDTAETPFAELIAEGRKAAERATESDSDCYWDHFFFGVFKRDDATKFVAIHNKHHLKIIADILAKRV